MVFEMYSKARAALLALALATSCATGPTTRTERDPSAPATAAAEQPDEDANDDDEPGDGIERALPHGLGLPVVHRGRLAQLAREVERRRELRFREAVRAEALPRAAFAERLHAAATRFEDPSDVTLRRLTRIGVWPEPPDGDESTFGLEASAVEDAAVAYYDWTDDVLVIRTDVLGAIDAERDREHRDHVLMHELAHALADQHHDLHALDRQADGLDGRLALRCVIEGEASLIAEGPDAEPLRLGDDHPLAATHPLVRASLTAPYQLGVRYVRAQVRERGWSAIDTIYRRGHIDGATLFGERSRRSTVGPILLRAWLGDAARAVVADRVTGGSSPCWHLFVRPEGRAELARALRRELRAEGEVRPVDRGFVVTERGVGAARCAEVEPDER